MKKFLIITCIITALSSLCCSGGAPVPREGRMEFIVGDVQLVQGENSAPAKVGDAVKQGMTIITQEKSFASIKIGESVIRVNKNTAITFEALTGRPGETNGTTGISAEEGTMLVQVTGKLKKEESFKISAHAMVAAVRGTEFLLIGKNDSGVVACYEGTVEVTHLGEKKDDTILLKQGEMTRVTPGNMLTAEPITEEFRKEHYLNPDFGTKQAKTGPMGVKGADAIMQAGKTAGDKNPSMGTPTVKQGITKVQKQDTGESKYQPGEKPKAPVPEID